MTMTNDVKSMANAWSDSDSVVASRQVDITMMKNGNCKSIASLKTSLGNDTNNKVHILFQGLITEALLHCFGSRSHAKAGTDPISHKPCL